MTHRRCVICCGPLDEREADVCGPCAREGDEYFAEWLVLQAAGALGQEREKELDVPQQYH